ncbi:MAG: flagellin lysine-N-methylase, partial [Eubacteriales bacterium]
MRLIQPDFYDQFQCTASACSDTCCAGWGIVVDRETVAQYRQATGAIFGEVRQKLVDDGDDVVFAMEPDGRCPFLNQDNLCSLILAEGEDCLCQICTDHPRFFAWYGDIEESGIGLCCEEGARLLLERDKPLTLLEREDETEGDWDFAADILFGLRETLLEITFDPALTPWEKWAEMVELATETQLDLAPEVEVLEENPLSEWKKHLEIMEN